MSFICMRTKNHFYIKGWALNLVLIQRPGKLGNAPLSVRSGGDRRGTLVLISEYNDKNFNFVSLKALNFIAPLYRWRHLMNRFMPFLVNCFLSVVQNDSIFKVEKKVLFNKDEKWWRWPQKLNFWNYRINWHIQKEHDEKYSLAKNHLFGANWWKMLRICLTTQIIIS